MSKTDHPAIIKYHNSFIQGTDLHIILDLAESGDLAQAIQKQIKLGRYNNAIAFVQHKIHAFAVPLTRRPFGPI
jgi:hypothetical protein